MELVHAPVPELKTLLTQSFEDWARLRQGSGEAGSVSCALSGGATALIFLPALRAANVDWSKITLFWVDERAVPADDPESNYGIAERMLLSPLGAQAPRALRMSFDSVESTRGLNLAQDRPADALSQAALAYDDLLGRELGSRALDLAILGIGEDGHVASIFKGAQGAQGAQLRVMAVEDAPKIPRRRLSLTMPYLLKTRRIWIVAVGPRKLPVLQAALSKTQRSTPLDLVLHQAKDVTVFTDQVIRRR